MEISNKIPAAYATPPARPGANSGATGSKPLSCGATEDQVHLSDSAQQLKAAQEVLRQLPEVDLKKVAEIKARLAEGRYLIDSQKIASKLLEDSLLGDSE